MNTGACTNTRPRASQRATRSAVGRTAVVVWSTIQVADGMAAAIGSSTASTDASSASDRWMRSTPCSAAAASSKARAPSSTKARVLAGLRFQTLTFQPLARARRTKPAPIKPVPKKAILMAHVLQQMEPPTIACCRVAFETSGAGLGRSCCTAPRR